MVQSRVSSKSVVRTHDNGKKPGLFSRLAAWAGLAEVPSVDQLEKRELLFTLTVTADSVDPNTGIGQVTGYFAYVIPHLIRSGEAQQNQTGQTVTESFDQQPPGARGSGQFYAESQIQALHAIAPPQDFAVEPLATGGQTNDRWMKISMDRAGEFFAFRLWDDADNPTVPIQARTVRFTVRPNNVPGGPVTDVTGILPDLHVVELLSNNNIVATFTGNQIRAAIQNGNPNQGVGDFTFNAPANNPGFDTIRVRALSNVSGRPDFQLDNLAFDIPPAVFAPTIPADFGARITLAGPVGASVTLTDLYGRDMVQTLRTGALPGGQGLLVDLNDDGIPDFNDGIGAIRLTGTDSRTALSMWGGTVSASTTQPQDADTWDGQFAFTLADGLEGLYDDFEGKGFGYVLRVQNNQAEVAGLPGGPGSVIIGSPFVRPLNNYNPNGNAAGAANPIISGFTNPNQGIFVDGDINSIMIHGVVHGSSNIAGAAQRVNIGYLVGSLSVDGDLGYLAVGSDAGMWAPDPDFQPPPDIQLDAVNKTNGSLTVGRTVGEILVGGRMLMDVTVVGDLNSPTSRPARDVFNYWEKERNFGTGTTGITALQMARNQMNATNFVARNAADLFRNSDQGVLFGLNNYLRNDTLIGAEFIGSVSGGVHLRGELSGVDLFNGEDRADVFAFAVDGTSEVVVEGANSLPNISPYFRIMDQDGRTLAAPELPLTAGRFNATQLRFKPTGPGVYYLVLSDPNGNDTATGNTPYSVVVTGMAPVTLGAVRSAGGFGFTDINSGEGNSITVLSGSVGSVRVGTGLVDGGGEDASPLETYNTVQNDDDSLSFQGGTFSISGSLYNITAGSDFGAPHTQQTPPDVVFQIGGDLGTLFVGMSPVVGGGPGEGDLNFLHLAVGGRIALIDVRGGIGMDQDATDPRGSRGAGIVNIRSGVSGGNGDIGMIRTGFHVYGDSTSITTSPGSTIGAILTSQEAYFDTNPRSGIYLGLDGLNINSGFGSDVKFVDLIQLDLSNSVNVTLPIIGDRPLQIVDDSGVAYTIDVEGAPPDVLIGQVTFMPIDGSQGVAVGRIAVDLSGGRILRVTPMSGGTGGGGGTVPGVVGIGHIFVTNSDAASAIEFTGNVEIDVLRIDAPGGLDHISNLTPGGDIVFADVGALRAIEVAGDLGRTQLPAWGPANYAPFLGVNAGDGGEFGGALGFNAGNGLFDDDFNGDTFRPVGDDNFDAGNAYLDDIGGPMDGWLNGLVVRAGGLVDASIDGAVGDLILNDPLGVLQLLNVNADLIAPLGRFDGIFGTVFARDIGRLQLGAGVVNPAPWSPLAVAGIFAEDDILEVVSAATGTRFSAPIVAGNFTRVDLPGIEQDGINSFIATSATIDGLFLASQNLDGFWTSFNFGEQNTQTGDLNTITLTNTNFFRSMMRANDIRTVNITGILTGDTGYFDASEVAATGNMGSFTVRGFRNSTLQGDGTELRRNIIEGAGDIDRLTALEDIQDLIVDFTGRVRQSVSARNIERSSIDVDNELAAVTVLNDLRGSEITVGALPVVTVGRNIASSTVTVSGALTAVTVAGAISNGLIQVTGPSGSIGTITAVGGISGQIAASGPIGTVSVTGGDLTAHIRTTTTRGNVTALSAGRDVAISSDISGNLGTITAGRHIGNSVTKAPILVRGDLASASAPNGQLHGDLRVGGAIVGTITLGGATNKPGNNQVGSGSILAFKSIAGVTINGDFDGDIVSYGGGIASVAINNGSLLPGNTIAAYDGSLASVVITNGSLFGNVHADVDVTSLRVVAGADSVFGDVGVNPASSALVSYDARRNQLPVGVAQTTGFQGPRISAGRNVVSFVVTSGSMFESTVWAGQSVQTMTIGGSVSNDAVTTGSGSIIAAGDSIDNVSISGSLSNAFVMAGVQSFGADNRPGGKLENLDAIKPGSITKVVVSGQTSDTLFLAGIDAGVDGLYNSSDDRSVLGLSSITTLTLGSVGANVVARGDILSTSVANDGRLIRSGAGLTSTNADLDTGAGSPGTSFTGNRTFNYGPGTVTISTSGAGQFFFDSGTGRLTIRNSTPGTNVTIASSTGSLANFDVVTNDDASLGSLVFQAALTGDSDVAVDGGVGTLTFAAFSGTGSVAIGGNITGATFASLAGGFFAAQAVQTFRVNGDFGASNSLTLGEAAIQILSGGTFNITGAAKGTVSVDRSLTSLVVNGAADRAGFRVGGSLGTFSAASVGRSLVAVGDTLTTLTVGGDVFASSFMAGLDLGRDVAFDSNGLVTDTEGLNADAVSTGSITTTTIAGNFRESNLVAGYYRNFDGFFGSADDNLASGRSSIGAVTIGGTQVGSTRASETYRIGSTGTVGLVTIGGATLNGGAGNFGIETPVLAPAAFQVSDLRVTSDAGVFQGEIQFNQPIDASTVSRALSISEVRGNGSIEIRLIEGPDFTLSYRSADNTAVINFSRALTSQNLPVVPGRPGPGVYRFELASDSLRAKLYNQALDGNADGGAITGDDYSQDTVVGDAGDKVVSGRGTSGTVTVDFYAPANLDFMLDDNAASDGLPDINHSFTVRGSIGDHPDANVNFFSFASDVDVYAITLQAGQILQLGALQGPGSRAGLTLVGPNGQAVPRFANAATALALPTDRGAARDFTFPESFLVKTTGTYHVVIGGTASVANLSNLTVPNIATPPGGVGAYTFTVSVFDDGDSGFTSTTDSGNGAPVVNAPTPGAFAGNDQLFGTVDDLSEIVVGDYTFTYSRGLDNLPNTADDLVTGTNSAGITSTRDGNGRLVTTIESSIGPSGHLGVPSEIAADVDVYHLNNRQPIAPNTPMKLTVKLSDKGSNLGSAIAPARVRNSTRTVVDNRGFVQVGLFDTSSSAALDDALLVFSPTDFRAFGGNKPEVLSSDGVTSYGYDANGDFYIEFLTPDRMGVPGASGSFAVYIQGATNSDYALEVITNPSTGTPTETSRQNFYIETNGGSVDWLQIAGISTQLAGFDPRALGFAGLTSGGAPVRDYLISAVVAQLNGIYQGAGYDVRFSADPTAFGAEQFSTIYLSSTNDPLVPIFDPFNLFNFDFLNTTQFFTTQPYGFSEASDPFNSNKEDEGVVFVPSFALQGYTPSQSDVDRFSRGLSAAIGRRAGELMGLRLTGQFGAGGPFDLMAANSPGFTPAGGQTYSLPNIGRDLSDAFDETQSTDFFLGRMNSVALLRKFVSLR
ncbi:MAG: hypothetical protein WAZ94_09150 [Phycisphaerales bacterium]